jgi:hypothetical protein
MVAFRRDVLIKWTITLLVGGLLLGSAWLTYGLVTARRAAETVEVKKKLEGGRIKLSAKEAELNLQVEKVKDIEWVPKLAVYGRVVSNPSATTEVRAAFAGRLRRANGNRWPTIAGHVKAGDVLGHLEVRAPQDRLDLVAKSTEARLRVEGARKIWVYQQNRVKRFELSQPSIPRSELDAALVALAEAETQVAVNEAAAKLWQDALTALDQHGDLKQITWSLPILAPSDGEITELAGRPDMAVEAGSLIAKVVDFGKALVRVDIPSGLRAQPTKTLTFSVLPSTPPAFEGPTNRPEPREPTAAVTGELAGVAGQVDATGQTTGYLYQVNDTQRANKDVLPVNLLRPGLFVSAQLAVPGKAVSALTVPKSAVVYHQGRALVYIELPPKEKTPAPARAEARFFQRVEVGILGREENALIVTGYLVDGDTIVTEGAVYLLSAEFRTDTDD